MIKKLNDYEGTAKAIATLECRVTDADKIGQALREFQNCARSKKAKISQLIRDENKPITESVLKNILTEPEIKWAEFMELAIGNNEAYRNKVKFKGIIPFGKQLSLFEPRYEPAGTLPATTHKGGIASAK